MSIVVRIAQAPDPADSGTILQVADDEGDRLPRPPWQGLIFPFQEVPIEGVNAETVDVLDVSNDAVTIMRGGTPITITDDLQLAVLAETPVYNYGEDFTLVGIFSPPDPPYSIRTRDPGGGTALYDATDAGNGTATYSPPNPRAGTWWYRFEGVEAILPEADFFVRPGNV